MSRDPAVADLERQLRDTLDRMAAGLAHLGERIAADAAMVTLTFRAPEDMERDIARFTLEHGYRSQAAALRALVRRGIDTGRSPA